MTSTTYVSPQEREARAGARNLKWLFIIVGGAFAANCIAMVIEGPPKRPAPLQGVQASQPLDWGSRYRLAPAPFNVDPPAPKVRVIPIDRVTDPAKLSEIRDLRRRYQDILRQPDAPDEARFATGDTYNIRKLED